MKKIDASSLSGAIHSYWQTPLSSSSYRYQGVGGSLYRNFISVASGLNSTPATPWRFVAMKPGLGSMTFTYFTDGAGTNKDNGTSILTWGVSVPTATITTSAIDLSSLVRVFEGCNSLSAGSTAWTAAAWDNITTIAQLVSLSSTLKVEGSMALLGSVITSAYPKFVFKRYFSSPLDLSYVSVSSHTEEDYIEYWVATNEASNVEYLYLAFTGSTFEQADENTYAYKYASTLSGFTNNTLTKIQHRKSHFTRTSLWTWSSVKGVAVEFKAINNSWSTTNNFRLDNLRLRRVGGLDGTYKFQYIFTQEDSSSLVIARSNPMSSTDAITVNESGILVESLPSAGIKELYRSFDNDFADYFYDGRIPAGNTVYISSRQDALLGQIIEYDNDLPVGMSDIIGPHFDRIFGIATDPPDKIVFSKAKYPDAFPAFNYFFAGSPADPPQRLALWEGVLYILTKQTIYTVVGDEDFLPVKTRAVRGIDAKQSLAITPNGIYYLGRDGIWFFDGVYSRLVSGEIDPVFYGTDILGIDAFNMSQISKCQGAYFEGKYFLAYPHTGQTNNTRVLVFDEEQLRFYRWNFTGVRVMYVEQDNNFLVCGAADGFAWYAEKGLLSLSADASALNSTATLLTAMISSYQTGRKKLVKDLYVDADIPDADGMTITPVIDGTVKTALSLAQTSSRALAQKRTPGYVGHLFEWRMQSESFFRLFGISVDASAFGDSGYTEQKVLGSN